MGRLDVIGTKAFLNVLRSAKPSRYHYPFLKIAIATRLAAARPNVVTQRELLDAAYRDDPEGGPLYADDCVRAIICRLRKEGVPILTCGKRGYRLRESP